MADQYAAQYSLLETEPGTHDFHLAVEDKIIHLTAETSKEIKLIK